MELGAGSTHYVRFATIHVQAGRTGGVGPNLPRNSRSVTSRAAGRRSKRRPAKPEPDQPTQPAPVEPGLKPEPERSSGSLGVDASTSVNFGPNYVIAQGQIYTVSEFVGFDELTTGQQDPNPTSVSYPYRDFESADRGLQSKLASHLNTVISSSGTLRQTAHSTLVRVVTSWRSPRSLAITHRRFNAKSRDRPGSKIRSSPSPG